jgi:hypothetical protein
LSCRWQRVCRFFASRKAFKCTCARRRLSVFACALARSIQFIKRAARVDCYQAANLGAIHHCVSISPRPLTSRLQPSSHAYPPLLRPRVCVRAPIVGTRRPIVARDRRPLNPFSTLFCCHRLQRLIHIPRLPNKRLL